MIVTRAVRIARRINREFRNERPSYILGLLVKRYGIKVEPYPFADEVSGFLWQLRGRPIIAVNCCHPRERQLFTLAHEMGHYLLGHETGFLCGDIFADARAIEREANSFAAELLMPASETAAMVREKLDPQIMARIFGVSDDALAWRLRELGFF